MLYKPLIDDIYTVIRCHMKRYLLSFEPLFDVTKKPFDVI